MYNDFVVYVSAGGQSTRLYPLTIQFTKAWIDIGNKTPLLLSLRALSSQVPNLEIFILTQGLTNNIFIPLELRDGKTIGNGARVEYVHFFDPRKKYSERTLTRGSGEGFINFLERYKEKIGNRDVLAINVDNLANFSLEDMLKYHRDKKSQVTIGVTELNNESTISQFGTLKFDQTGKVLEFREKSPEPASNYINTGIVLFSPTVFDVLRGKSLELSDIGGSIIPYLLNKASVYAYGAPNDKYGEISNWVDFGTVESYLKTNGDVLLGRYPWFDYSGYVRLGQGILVHRDSIEQVKDAVRERRLKLDGFVIIGSNPAFYGEQQTQIENAVIGHNVKLQGANIKGIENNGDLFPTVLLDSSGVFDSNITAAVIGYSSNISSNGKRTELEPFSVVGNELNLSSVYLSSYTRVASDQDLKKILEANRYSVVYFGNGLVFFSEINQRYNPFK
ncbi:MAG: hypothetical protein KQA41_02475 [Candidatus Aenigmarchaeota archaeon]|nr:hypothetical protein [Candidatus Aenigmarchaeota archaeon]